MDTEGRSRNQRSAAVSAEDQPQRPRKPRTHPLESEVSSAVSLLRLVLGAHSRAPGKILPAREDFEQL